MTAFGRLRDGADVAGRLWPLLVTQAVVFVLTIALFTVCVSRPVENMLHAAGISASESGDAPEFLGIARSASAAETLMKLAGHLLMVLVGIIVYFTFAMVIGTLNMGGGIASIAGAVDDPSAAFSMRTYLRGAREKFWSLIWYMTFWSTAAMFAALVIAALFIGGYYSFHSGSSITGGAAVIAVMILVLIFLITALSAAGGFMMYVQGLAPLALEGLGVWASVRRAYGVLNKDNDSLRLLATGTGVLIAVAMSAALVGYVIEEVLKAGPIVVWPYNLAGDMLTTFIMISLMAAVFARFRQAHAPLPSNEDAGEPDWLAVTREEGHRETDASAPEAPAPAPPRPDEDQFDQT